ncbi:TPA: restriction endonuclease [Streptococcus pneumoniae]|nr:restriction endonuclease [Streptococcus pneumoniae]
MTKISFEIQQQIIQCFGLCFHYKDTVVSFMQTSGVPNDLILKWKSEPKFVWAKNVINELNKTENGRLIIRRIATEFYKMKNIPDEVQDRDRGLDALRKLKRLIGDTQQLDGYFRFEGFDYLVEMKWEKNPVNSPKIASLKQKVDTKLTSTRGLFLSINGFRDEVIQDFSNKDAKILFMDGQELAYILENRISLYEALKVKIIGASKTGNPNVSIINQE